MKFQPSKHKALLVLVLVLVLLVLLLVDIGLFLASTSTIIDRIPPKESLSASLAGGVHLTGGHFRWEKQIYLEHSPTQRSLRRSQTRTVKSREPDMKML